MKYEIIESKVWKHLDGRTASIYGAAPLGPGWAVVAVGWTVRNPRSGIVGIGKAPWFTRAEAELWAASHTPISGSIAD